MTPARLGLSRAQRLRRPADFQAITRTGLKLRDALFTVYVAPGGPGAGRLGIAVSRRVSAKAVGRNRIKRQIRESFRLHQAMLAALDVIVIAHAAAASADTPAIKRALERHWQTVSSRCARS